MRTRKTAEGPSALAISPPSDIVLDVARAAEPMDIETARAALLKRAGGVAASFTLEMGPRLSRETAATAGAAPAEGTEAAQGFRRFEAMVLQTFIQNMLPKDAEGVYGKGLAGDMWKSQLAEKLANVMADKGGIGIARSLLADHYMQGKRPVPVGPVSGGADKSEIDEQSRLSAALVQETQRKIARSLSEDRTQAKGTAATGSAA